MSGLKYETQDRNQRSHKHTFDYNFCKQKYDEYALMNLEEFRECLKDKNKIGELGHLCCFILWVKNKEQHEYRECLGDYGLIHLLFHCAEHEEEAERNAEYIHMLFKEDVRLV